MKSIIICDSMYGNTVRIAEAIGDGMNSHSETKVARLVDLGNVDWNTYDMIVYGSPTHGGRPSDKSQNFFSELAGDIFIGKKAAAFDTSLPKEGQNIFLKIVISILPYAAPRIGKLLQSKGADVIATESFFVTGKEGPLKEGELERAKEWGAQISKINGL